MIQKDKQLLLIDLCSRLPYDGLMVRWGDEDFNIIGVCFGRVVLLKPFMSNVSGSPLVEEVKPYLRKMSNMTEEERNEAAQFEINDLGPIGFNWNLLVSNSSELVNWLNAHHFDYRGLIEKGLALEAPKGMYKI